MKKPNSAHVYLAAMLSILVPAPARFGYTLILVLLTDVTMLIASSLRLGLKKLHINELSNFFLLATMVFLAVLYKILISAWSPLIGMILGFIVYLVPSSSFLVGYILFEKQDTNGKPLNENPLVLNMASALIFTVSGLLFSFFRELISFGTISFPSRDGLVIYKWFKSMSNEYTSFFATIPGAFVLLALIFAVITFVVRKINIQRRKR